MPVAGLAVGLPLGIYVFNELNESQLLVVIGITLLVAVGFLAGLRGSGPVPLDGGPRRSHV